MLLFAKEAATGLAHLRKLDDVLDAVNPDKGAIGQLLHGIPRHDVAVLIEQVCCCLQQPAAGLFLKRTKMSSVLATDDRGQLNAVPSPSQPRHRKLMWHMPLTGGGR